MVQRRPKRGRGPKPKEGALRREPKLLFIPGPVHAPILDKLAAERTNGNKNALIRLLLEEASAKNGNKSIRLVCRSRGRDAGVRTSAARGTRGLLAA